MRELTEIHREVLAEMRKSQNRMYEIGDDLGSFLQVCFDEKLQDDKSRSSNQEDWDNYDIKGNDGNYNTATYPGLEYYIEITHEFFDKKKYTISIYPSGQVLLTAQVISENEQQESEDLIKDQFSVDGLSVPAAIAKISNHLTNIDYEGLGCVVVHQAEYLYEECQPKTVDPSHKP